MHNPFRKVVQQPRPVKVVAPHAPATAVSPWVRRNLVNEQHAHETVKH
jgi:hypothetical protein